MAEAGEELLSFTLRWMSQELGRNVNADAAFATMGLDSLDVVRLTDALAEHMGIDELPVSIVLDHPNLSSLVKHLATLKTS
jgi:acyl carrier protein